MTEQEYKKNISDLKVLKEEYRELSYKEINSNTGMSLRSAIKELTNVIRSYNLYNNYQSKPIQRNVGKYKNK